MFTLEIDGVAVAVTDADQAGAEEIFGSEEFQEDLASLTTDGRPLWDGAAAFTIRPASGDEAGLFEDAVLETDEEDEDEEPGFEVMFLVPVDQFGDDDEDEEA